MARQIQFRRGTTTEHSTFTGAVGEVTVDTDKDVVVVHDGATQGGHPLVRATSLSTVATTGSYTDLSNTPTVPVVGTDALAYDANLQGFVDAFTLPTTDGSSGQALTTDGAGNVTFADAGISTGKAIAMAIVFGG